MLAITLCVSATFYAAGVVRVWQHAGWGQGIRYAQALAFIGSWFALVAALVWLDELSEQLFSVHMAQHELLMLVAAPLIAAAAPWIAILWMLPAGARRRVMLAVRRPAVVTATGLMTAPATVWCLHAGMLWVWHLPALYEAALAHEGVHIVQHLSFFVSAALFWWGLAHGRYGRIGYGAAVLYVFATAVHSGVLGALLTFSPHVWYPLYESTTARFDLTPLEDQQLAGLLMWVPASLVFIAAGLYFFAAWVRESERRAQIFATR
jgi:putative membrane protein